MKKLLVFVLLCIIQTSVNAGTIKKYEYLDFTLWLDCSERMATKFEFITKKDTGNFPRLDAFHFDKNVPLECQQKSVKTYGSVYDRGHLVSSNQEDSNINSEFESFNMTNVLPQTKELNRGAWLQTEKITECQRDKTELHVYGGSILGTDRSKDFFVKLWGVKTPNYFWKVIIDETNNRNIAWLFPNNTQPTAKNINQYIVNIDYINQLTHDNIKPKNSSSHDVSPKSWELPSNCNFK